MKDPRGSSLYRRTKAQWLPTADTTCALCGKHVDTLLPPGYPQSPTVEHTLPIRTILTMTQTWDEAVTLACDTTLWAMAHHLCQSRQGGKVQRGATDRSGFRDW